MIFGKLYEVIDSRKNDTAGGVCLLDSHPGLISANFETGYSETYPLDDDDALEILGDMVTIRTADGEISFIPLTPEADVLEVIGIDDFDRLFMNCANAR